MWVLFRCVRKREETGGELSLLFLCASAGFPVGAAVFVRAGNGGRSGGIRQDGIISLSMIRGWAAKGR